MSVMFASPKLAQATEAIKEQQLDGCISIDYLERGYHRYGTLQYQNGQLTGAQYHHYQGNEALEMIQDLHEVSVTFAAGALVIQ